MPVRRRYERQATARQEEAAWERLWEARSLKAVAVKGTKSIYVARPEGFMDAIENARKVLKAHPVTGEGLGAYGTEILVNIINESGALPLRNGRDGSFVCGCG